MEGLAGKDDASVDADADEEYDVFNHGFGLSEETDAQPPQKVNMRVPSRMWAFPQKSDDQYKIIGTSSGSGSLPSGNVNTLAIDNDGEIWIGTDNGPTIFYSSYPIFNETNYDN